MTPIYDMGYAGFGIMSVIFFIVWLAMFALGIYVTILVIKALKVYINKNS